MVLFQKTEVSGFWGDYVERGCDTDGTCTNGGFDIGYLSVGVNCCDSGDLCNAAPSTMERAFSVLVAVPLIVLIGFLKL